MKRRVILYGAGKIGKEAAYILKGIGENIECYIDKNAEKHGTLLNDIPVCYIAEVQDIAECIVYITTVKGMTHIVDEVVSYGVKRENIILYDLFRINYLANRKCSAYSSQIVDKERVVFDCYNGLGLGGIEEWTKQLTTELCDRKYDVKILYSGEKQKISNELVYVENIVEKGLLTEINEVVDCLIQSNCGVVVTSQPGDVLRAACVMKSMGINIRIICVIHGGTESNYERYPVYDQYVDAYVGVSEDICKELVNRGIDENIVFHMTCPVKLMDKEKSRIYTSNSDFPINIGYAGRIEIEQKRMDLLLELIWDLEKRKVSYHMNIAGAGSYRNYMEKVIDEKQLNSRVKFWGQIDRSEIAYFWQNNDICINLADFEGRSISIMEAMINGAVPVVTQTSGVKEDIYPGINGFYVDIGDYSRIGQYISYLSENRSELNKLGKNARVTMEEKCEINKHVDFWCELLERIGNNDKSS